MFSYLIARIKQEHEYSWFTYKGKPIGLPFRGKTERLEQGQIFGVRPSSDGKKIRLVFEGQLTRVFTIDQGLASRIARSV